jgi:tetratricopeptide (TPR) repeat protein
MTGETTMARPVAQRVAELQWGHPFEILIGPPLPTTQLAAREAAVVEGPAVDDEALAPALTAIAQIERLRQGVHDAVSTSALTTAGLDEWEETVVRHGQATRYRPAGLLLGELAADFVELHRVLARQHTSSALRRLTRTTAQMAGLMFLTLIKLNAPGAARNWARTARVASDEADDPAVRSWVRAQEAYVHYYAGDLAEAIAVARHAQTLAGATVCVGLPLAAALEGRAWAAMGQEQEARAALARAEAAVSALDPDALVPSAFGYNEAQLRFHEGNALTQLHDAPAARTAHDRAVALYPSNDYLDRTLLELDRASCLIYDGDVDAAMTHATQLLVALSDEQRHGLILLRGRQLYHSLRPDQRVRPAARDFHNVLMTNADADGTCAS